VIRTGQGNNGGGPNISPTGQRANIPGPNEEGRGFFRHDNGHDTYHGAKPPNSDGSVAKSSADPDRGPMVARRANLRGAGQQPNSRKPKGY
jgi:hypothetical protein